MKNRPMRIVQQNSLPGSPKNSLKDKGADLSTLRTFNTRLVMNYLLSNPQTSRVDIADELGLSRATVTSIIDDLKKNKFVEEGGKLDSPAPQKSGRPANRIHFNANAGYCLAVDIGRSHLIIHLTNLLAEPVNQWSSSFDMADYDGHEGLKFIAERIRDVVRRSRVPWGLIRGIGVAIPGVPDPTFHMLISPPILHKWKDIDIPATLRRYLNLKKYIPVHLDNDANMGALAESRYGAGRGIPNFVYIKIGIGIGAGLILNGSLFRGSRNVAGEFGHMILVEDAPGQDISKIAPLCPSCERYGCLESLAGIGAIIQDARNGTSLRQERPDTDAVLPGLAHYNHKIDMDDVVQQADEHDEAARAALRHAGKRIGRAIGGCLLNMYNPSRILLGGGAIRLSRGARTNELLLSSIRESAKLCTLPAAWEGVEILPSLLTDNPVALGAIIAVIDQDKDFGSDSLTSFGPMGQVK